MTVSNDQLRQLALALPGTSEQDHFGKPSFRVAKKIFATLHVTDRVAVLKLSVADQTALVAMEPEIYFTGGWAHQGWTMVRLKKVRKAILSDQLLLAWKQVAPKRMIKAYGEGS